MVSVIIPTFNRENTIKKSIYSVLNQTYRDLELIIVDDGSTDRTEEIVKSINDPRVKYVWQYNQGACIARNRGIEIAQGEYIAFQDSDDIWTTDKLERQLHIFENNNTIDIVCCKTKCKRLNGSVLLTLKNTPEGIIDRKIGPYGISTQTLVMKNSVTEVVKFDSNVSRYQDLDFLLTAHQNYTIYCLDDYLVERYIEDDSITNHPERVYKMAKYFESKYKDLFDQEGGRLPRFFAGALLEAGKQMKTKQERKIYYRQALAYNSSIRMYLKFIMIKFNLYSLYRKLVEKREVKKLEISSH